jgi:hypothetical protein
MLCSQSFPISHLQLAFKRGAHPPTRPSEQNVRSILAYFLSFVQFSMDGSRERENKIHFQN